MLTHLFRKAPLLVLLIAITFSFGCADKKGCAHKQVIGATAVIQVEEVEIDFIARIDTGARTTSIHALNFNIANEAPTKEENIGKEISFDLFDAQGKATRLTATIKDVTKVRNAQGVEYRYQVPLTLKWKDDSRPLMVNLRDRSAMTYPLLIGRDYLRGMLVDVDRDTGE